MDGHLDEIRADVCNQFGSAMRVFFGGKGGGCRAGVLRNKIGRGLQRLIFDSMNI
jgi:hypothetical protein